jgi:hypothetical protein
LLIAQKVLALSKTTPPNEPNLLFTLSNYAQTYIPKRASEPFTFIG